MKLITNPDEFFAELKTKDGSIKIPILIIIGIAILGSISYYFFINKIIKFLGIFPENIVQILTVGAYITTFITVFVIWLIITVIVYGLSALFGGEGSFYRTFTFIGYGFLPSLIGSLITTPISVYYIMNAEIPEIDLTQLEQNPEIIDALITSLLPNEIIYSTLIINIAMIVWSLVIWSFALKHAREIDLRKAFICVLIPTVPLVIYQIWSVLTSSPP